MTRPFSVSGFSVFGLFLFLTAALAMLVMPEQASAQDSRIVSCASNDMRYHTCEVGSNRGVRMVRQRSESPCERNRTYGVRGDQIWVDRGCRAEFEVMYGNNRGGNRGNDRGGWDGWGNNSGGYGRDNNFGVICSSNDMRRNYCDIGRNRGVRLVRQISESRCEEGRSFGVRGSQLWVDRGCRGQFEVRAR